MSTEFLIVPSASVASGVATYVEAQARALVDFDIAVMAVPGSDLAGRLPVPVIATTGDVSDMAARISGTDALLMTHGPRALLAARLGRVPGLRIHHVFHEIPWSVGRRGAAEVLLSVGVRRLTNSPASRSVLARVGIRTAAALPPVVFPAEALNREAARARLGIDGHRLVGVIGRLHPVKEPELAIDALAATGRRLKLVFVGDGPLRASLSQRAAAAGIDAHFVGHLAEAAEVMRAFDAVLVPSRRETFGLVLAEAVLAGVPVAAVRSPGSRLLTDGGRLLPLAEPAAAALAEALRRALDGSVDAAVASYVRKTFGETAAAVHVDYVRGALRG